MSAEVYFNCVTLDWWCASDNAKLPARPLACASLLAMASDRGGMGDNVNAAPGSTNYEFVPLDRHGNQSDLGSGSAGTLRNHECP